ncbi:MAG: zinc-binding dehydrogenase [Candidatus Binatia bacterium]|nr:zinc-binding dehydrogenase [Candidatus Binatia bacterium]
MSAALQPSGLTRDIAGEVVALGESRSALGSYAWPVAQPTGEGMAEIAQLAAAGKIRPQVTDTYPLGRVAEAHARLEAGHIPGEDRFDARLGRRGEGFSG